MIYIVMAPIAMYKLFMSHSGHGAELFYVFHTYDEYFTEGEKRLADTVSRYWANFVKTGNPNTAGDNDISDGSCAADGSECTVSIHQLLQFYDCNVVRPVNVRL